MTIAPLSSLTICGLDELDDHSRSSVTHVLSILDPAWPEPEAFFAYDPHHRTTLHFHDAVEPSPDIQLPRLEHVEEILAFGRALQRDRVERPDATEELIFKHLVAIRPQAWPNSLMIAFADDLLARGGRLTAALRRHYGRRLAARPELAATMRGLNRAREVEMAMQPG